MQPSLFDNGDLGVFFGRSRRHGAATYSHRRRMGRPSRPGSPDRRPCSTIWKPRCRGVPNGVRCTTRCRRPSSGVFLRREDQPLPDALLTEAKDALSSHYFDELGEPFATSGLCFYRDGHRQRCLAQGRHGTKSHRGHDGGHPVSRCGSARSYYALVGAANPSASISDTEIYSSWADPANARGNTVSRRVRGPSGRKSTFNSALAELDSVAEFVSQRLPIELADGRLRYGFCENNPTRLLVRRQSIADVRDQ